MISFSFLIKTFPYYTLQSDNRQECLLLGKILQAINLRDPEESHVIEKLILFKRMSQNRI